MGSCVSIQGRPRSFAKRRSDVRPLPDPALIESVRKSSVRHAAASILSHYSAGDNIFESYRFGKELGRGEFGITHQCFRIETGETFACKTISKSKLRSEINVEDVRREVAIMRSMPKHPNIVAFEEAFEDNEAVYLVMELCEGGELFDRIVSKGHYTERAAVDVTKTIIEICKVCHENGVIHRDLKPENFLFADESENAPLKAIDFGLSIFFEPDQRFSEIVGSPYYMAPEVLRRSYGPEVDVWSAGVILYILLCGVPPFWAESEEGIAHAIVRGNIDFERDPWPKVSKEAKELVMGMIDPNPYSRMTVDEVLEHPWIQNKNLARDVSLGENVGIGIKQFTVMNKFKKKVLGVVADHLSDEQMDGIRRMFHTMDTDKNGDLTFEELKNGMHMIGHSLSDPDVRMLMDAADMDGSGTLSCEEFAAISIHLRKMNTDELLTQAFRFFDKDQNGYIEYDELREALMDDNEKVIKDIISDVDSDKDGRISYKEFKAMLTTGMDWKMASRQYSRAMLHALSLKLFKDKSVAECKTR